MTKWYSLWYNHQCFHVQIKFNKAHEFFQWLPLIFNDFSRQNAIFPGQHKIPWLFKSRVKFHDFSRPVWTMKKVQLCLVEKLTKFPHFRAHHIHQPASMCQIWPIITLLSTHLPLDKMAAFSQTIFSDAFSWMKIFVFWSIFHWSLFLRFQLTITQHWLR